MMMAVQERARVTSQSRHHPCSSGVSVTAVTVAKGRRCVGCDVMVMDSDAHQSEDGRLSLSARLNSLLPNFSQSKLPSTFSAFSEPPSRRSGELVRHESMRSARTRPPSPRISTAYASNAPNLTRNMFNRSTQPLSLKIPAAGPSSQSQTHKRDQSQPAFPVLRWFTGKQTAGDHARTPTQSRPSTPLEYSDSPLNTLPPTGTAISALVDALDDDPRLRGAHTTKVDMPSRPQAAKLPPSLRPWRPPSHLSDLSRAALPTASISPTTSFYATPYADPFDDPFAEQSHSHNDDLDIFLSPTPDPIAIPHSPAPAHLNRSPPILSPSSTRSSIETLRSIQDRGRGIHTTPPSQKLSLPSFSNPFNWFTTDDDAKRKEHMDPYLSEEDKAHSGQAQKDHINQRCLYSFDLSAIIELTT